jgi:hypothetical protein
MTASFEMLFNLLFTNHFLIQQFYISSSCCYEDADLLADPTIF